MTKPAGVKILVVTEPSSPEWALVDILKAARYQVMIAGRDQALALLADEDPAVALIDLTKETEITLETVRKLHMRSPGTVIIVLKDPPSHRAAIKAIGLGAFLYVSKPLDAEQLLLIVRRAIERRETTDSRGELDERSRAFADNIKLPIALFDRYGIYLSANFTAASRLGSTPDAIVGKSIRYLRPEISDGYIEAIGQVMDSGVEKELPSHTTFHPIRNAKGQVTAVQVVEYAASER